MSLNRLRQHTTEAPLVELNKITVFDDEPLPDVDNLFSKLDNAKYFSKLDLTKGYWVIPIREEDKHKTAFSTPDGKFQ